jgi:hypothetical protein
MVKGKVKEAKDVKVTLRTDWQKLIVAVHESKTGVSSLDKDIVDAVIKFNTPECKDCKVYEEDGWEEDEIEVELEIHVQCSKKSLFLSLSQFCPRRLA